jgi:hypothetical protein
MKQRTHTGISRKSIVSNVDADEEIVLCHPCHFEMPHLVGLAMPVPRILWGGGMMEVTSGVFPPMDYDGLLALDRMERAVEKVRDRLLRSTAALEVAGIPYAVIGGNAVMAWVEQVDESAVRFTQDVDLVLRRDDLTRAAEALGKAGFIHRHIAGIDMFLDGPGAKARDAVHVIFSGEKVRPEYVAPAPDAAESVSFKSYRVLSLEALVRMKLTSNRDKDRTHVRDMISVGLIDASWPARYPPELAARLQHLIDTPDG